VKSFKIAVFFLTLQLGFPLFLQASSASEEGKWADFSFRPIDQASDPNLLKSGATFEVNLKSLDAASPKKVSSESLPWANGPWRYSTGLTASRYSDRAFSGQNNWQRRRSYVDAHSVESIKKISNRAERSERIDELSPAEKYDLLVGDSQSSLAEAQWREVARLDKNSGGIQSWMGICEGSAAASIIYGEPQKSVELSAPDGTPVRFHALDIKGLSALLWSSFNAKVPISGGRCATLRPAKDRNGIIIDPTCFDTNPGAFHIALMNLTGIRKSPFFINRAMSLQVWNAPVIGYEMQYFNPASGLVTTDLNRASCSPSEKSLARFLPYRAPSTASVVGVKMSVTVAAGETNARDASARSTPMTLQYTYDLELNWAGEVVGGEWYGDKHPNFIWAIAPDFKPLASGDVLLGSKPGWDGKEVPRDWLPAIQMSSSQNQPLERIVRKLVDLSLETP
jgi:hypothetical protein